MIFLLGYIVGLKKGKDTFCLAVKLNIQTCSFWSNLARCFSFKIVNNTPDTHLYYWKYFLRFSINEVTCVYSKLL